ncbi:hypothetical protein [Pedobacter antarcticus]|uniref:hypothetical protein n=1 Tax=Pedobacter antarcticus TaxID=34086 RepID=UPI00292D63BF|nr:hypothetical protein [Pedobacter antarcticus]
MQEINAWLKDSEDFDKGVELYVKYGTNSFFKTTLIKFGCTPFNIQKLVAELTALAPAAPAPQEPKSASNHIVTHQKPLPIPDEALPAPDPKDTERYLALKELLRIKYRQMDRNRAALAISSDKEYRHLTAKQIMKLDSDIKDIYRLIDYFDAHECFPQLTKDEIIRTPTEELQSLWVSNSRAKTRLKSGKCRNIHNTEQLIIKNNIRIEQLKRKVVS